MSARAWMLALLVLITPASSALVVGDDSGGGDAPGRWETARNVAPGSHAGATWFGDEDWYVLEGPDFAMYHIAFQATSTLSGYGAVAEVYGATGNFLGWLSSFNDQLDIFVGDEAPVRLRIVASQDAVHYVFTFSSSEAGSTASTLNGSGGMLLRPDSPARVRLHFAGKSTWSDAIQTAYMTLDRTGGHGFADVSYITQVGPRADVQLSGARTAISVRSEDGAVWYRESFDWPVGPSHAIAVLIAATDAYVWVTTTSPGWAHEDTAGRAALRTLRLADFDSTAHAATATSRVTREAQASLQADTGLIGWLDCAYTPTCTASGPGGSPMLASTGGFGGEAGSWTFARDGEVNPVGSGDGYVVLAADMPFVPWE